MKINNVLKLIIAVVVSELAGIVGSFFTMPSISNWYAELIKPSLNPPSWVFGPVWIVLFALMGISLFLIWKSDPSVASRERKRGIILFFIQLALNAFWSIIFFGLRNPGGAFVEIIFLWLAIIVTIITFFKVSKLAAWLLLPYIIWVSFAAYLNYSIWTLNIEIPKQEIQIDPRNATYIIEGESFALVGGKSEKDIPNSTSKILTQYFGNEVSNDFNGDNIKDVAFLLIQNSGGSGTFYYVAADISLGGNYMGTNAILLGDRIAPQSTEFRNDMIIVNYADRRPEESFSVAPSIGKSKYFKIIDNKLQEIVLKMGESEARSIAEKSCIKGGEALSSGIYNENSKTWWFDANLNAVKEGCNPACVVSEETKTAEVNWRCTGLITPK